MNRFIIGLVVSTIAFFVAGHYLRRYLDGMGIEKSMARSLVIFTLSLAIAYAVAFIIDWLGGLPG